MANFVLVYNGVYSGLSTDTKPTTNVPSGTKAKETDTGYDFIWNGTDWILDAYSGYLKPAERRGGFYGFNGSTTPAYGCWAVLANNSNGGAFSSTQIINKKTCGRWSTGNTINGIAGLRVNGSTNNGVERDQNPWSIFVLALTTITNARMFVGFQSNTIASASTADPCASGSGVGFWFDTGVHATNISILQNNGAANSDITTIPNVGTMVTGAVNTYEIRAVDASAKWQYRLNGYPNGAWVDINTAIPAATTKLGCYWYTETLAATAAKTFDIYEVHGRQDG